LDVVTDFECGETDVKRSDQFVVLRRRFCWEIAARATAADKNYKQERDCNQASFGHDEHGFHAKPQREQR